MAGTAEGEPFRPDVVEAKLKRKRTRPTKARSEWTLAGEGGDASGSVGTLSQHARYGERICSYFVLASRPGEFR
jgi:hypothetical protein